MRALSDQTLAGAKDTKAEDRDTAIPAEVLGRTMEKIQLNPAIQDKANPLVRFLEVSPEIVEGAWVTAHQVMRLLELQPKPPAVPPSVETEVPMQATTPAEGATARRKPTTAKAARSVPERPPATAVNAAGPADKVVVLSDLGTKKLVSAGEAQASASSSATAHRAIWQAPPSKERVTQLLERLDELLGFDAGFNKGPCRRPARRPPRTPTT